MIWSQEEGIMNINGGQSQSSNPSPEACIMTRK